MTGRVPDRTRTGSVRQQLNRPGIRQAAYRIRPYKTRQNQAKPLALHSTRPAGRSPQIFSAKPDSTLLRNASRAGAVVGVDVDTGTRLLLGSLNAQGVNQELSISDTLFAVPACWEVGWIQSIAIRSSPPKGGPYRCPRPAFRPACRQAVEPSGSTTIGPLGPIIHAAAAPPVVVIDAVVAVDAHAPQAF